MTSGEALSSNGRTPANSSDHTGRLTLHPRPSEGTLFLCCQIQLRLLSPLSHAVSEHPHAVNFLCFLFWNQSRSTLVSHCHEHAEIVADPIDSALPLHLLSHTENLSSDNGRPSWWHTAFCFIEIDSSQHFLSRTNLSSAHGTEAAGPFQAPVQECADLPYI